MRLLIATILLLTLTACGGQADEGADRSANGGTDKAPDGLTQDQIENGIGPVTTVSLGPLDHNLAGQGEAIFTTKCSACHKLDERYVGPPLRDVTERRTPGFIMNMMLNPAEMVEKHPDAKAMFAEYLTPMPNQQLTEADARAVLEYFRSVSNQ